MSNPGDRFKLAEAIRRGWEITPERKAQYFEQLDRVMANLDAITDPMRRAKCVAQCTRVLVAEQGQALRDLHHTERLQHEAGILDLRLRRAEEGKPNDCVAVQLQTPVRELPLPDGLRHYRKRVLESEN
jgi:hypothetical protein